MPNMPEPSDHAPNATVGINQGTGGRAAAGNYFETTLNFLTSERRIPSCTLRSWQPTGGAVASKYYLHSHQPEGFSEIVQRFRMGAIYVHSDHPRLYHSLIEAAAQRIGLHENCVQASFHTEAVDEFKGDLTLTLPTLLRCLPEDANHKMIVVNLMELAPLHQTFLDSLRDHSHPSAMSRVSETLAERGIYIVIVIDKSIPKKEIKLGVSVVEVDPLQAVKAEVLGNHKASDVDTARLDRIIESKLLGSEPWRNAAELHDRFLDGTLLSTIALLEDQLQRGDPRVQWRSLISQKLFPPEGSVFENADKRDTKHNAAVVEAGRITLFVFSLLESCNLSEFDELLRSIVGSSDQIEKIEIEYQYDVTSSDPATAAERKIAKRVNASVLEEFQKNRDGVFRELSVQANSQTEKYQLQLPFMRESARDLLLEKLPVSYREWFNRLVFETPTVFTSSDHVGRQLMSAYADWLSARSGDKFHDFAVLSWWNLAAKITQMGYVKAVEGVEDKNLLLLVGFLSERTAVHVFVTRACMFFQALMSRPALEHLVSQALNDIINNRGWNIALGVCKTLQTHSRFDAFHWIVQVMDRGDSDAREAASWLLVRLIESASSDEQRLLDVIKRMKAHLPADGVLKRPSERVIHTIVQRLVFGRSTKTSPESDGQVGAILPFFRSRGSVSVEHSVAGAAFLDLLRTEVDSGSFASEADATIEATKSLWFDISASQKKGDEFSRLVGAAVKRAESVGSKEEGFGILLALILIEAFASLRRVAGLGRDACVAAERALVVKFGDSLGRDGRHGILAGAAAAASTLVGLEEMEDRFEIAERLEKWAQP